MQDFQKVKLLWHSDFWDGVLSGLCEINGEQFWFNCHDLNIDPRAARCYDVYRLTPEQLETQLRWHDLFRKYVGTHCDYDESGTRTISLQTMKPQEECNKYYDKRKQEYPGLDLSDATLIGQFSEKVLKKTTKFKD